MFKNLLFALLIIASGYYYWTTRPVTHGPGQMAPNEPKQEKAFGVKDIQHLNYKINPLAKIEMQVRVLAKKKYYTDEQSDLIPHDVVFGWGPMSDERNLGHILIKQSDRDYQWEMTRPPIPEKQMKLHSANMHLIPSNMIVGKGIADLREGHIVKITGLLVKVTSDKGWTIRSSLSRKDVGSKANEVVWVQSIEIL